MSLCIALMDEQRVVMAADTAVSTKRGRNVYRVRENCQKIFVLDEMLVFLSGDVDLSRLIMDEFKEQDHKTVEKLRDMMQTYTERYAQIRPGFREYEKDSIGVLALIGLREGNKSMLYEISSKDNFKLKKIAPIPDKPIFYTVGVQYERANELVSQFLGEGQSANNAIISTYETLSCEQIGGTLQAYILDETGIESLIHRPIKNKAGMKTFRTIPINQADLKHAMFCHATIRGSSIDVGNGIFSVDTAGNMVATSGRFRGTIDASIVRGTDVIGGKVTGALIQTAASGKRIEMDVDGFRSFDSGGVRRISIDSTTGTDYSSLDFFDRDGSQVGQMYTQSGSLILRALRDMEIVSFGTTTLSGRYNVSGTDFIGLDTSKIQGLGTLLAGKADKAEAGYNLSFDSATRNLKMFSKTGQLLAQVNIPK